MFSRAVVEGLFGYDPDYPNRRVRLRPAFPSSWPKASIRTPDYSLKYEQTGDLDRYHLTLTRAAAVDFRLAVRAEKVRRVMLGGRETSWKAEAGFGCTWVRLTTPECKAAEVTIETAGRLPQAAAVMVTGKVGNEVRLPAPRGQISRWQDFHGVLEGAQADGAAIRGRLADKPGHHLVLAEVKVGELPQRQVFKLHVTDSGRQARLAAKTPREASKSAALAVSRPEAAVQRRRADDLQTAIPFAPAQTCSVRLGVDGYSGWCFAWWGTPVPAIDLANLQKLSDGRGRILTPQNVPFARFAGEDNQAKNIAFTSLWDNWPRAVTVPVGQRAESVWLLVCGSTNPMQTRIANAEVRFRYADGQVEKLELVPPLNFWTLCPFGGADYDYHSAAFCLPKEPPPTVQLGNNCRAMVLSWKLRPGAKLKELTLETLSQEVVIGLMGVSLMNPR